MRGRGPGGLLLRVALGLLAAHRLGVGELGALLRRPLGLLARLRRAPGDLLGPDPRLVGLGGERRLLLGEPVGLLAGLGRPLGGLLGHDPLRRLLGRGHLRVAPQLGGERRHRLGVRGVDRPVLRDRPVRPGNPAGPVGRHRAARSTGPTGGRRRPRHDRVAAPPRPELALRFAGQRLGEAEVERVGDHLARRVDVVGHRVGRTGTGVRRARLLTGVRTQPVQRVRGTRRVHAVGVDGGEVSPAGRRGVGRRHDRGPVHVVVLGRGVVVVLLRPARPAGHPPGDVVGPAARLVRPTGSGIRTVGILTAGGPGIPVARPTVVRDAAPEERLDVVGVELGDRGGVVVAAAPRQPDPTAPAARGRRARGPRARTRRRGPSS
ncbi:hypothetical protein [Nocardioides sp. TF02-7]|uniref:hypothetical protein n=1 Tax=Nocardioides sp. TF02-7 TaxID=2917724 RepID=UPI001F070F3B|nr:hypothetical protein [Nocardioides sp. TF02-7]UMG91109.1 hypothetical protein MF408_12955 [Nocardioides sp. TF02-7]